MTSKAQEQIGAWIGAAGALLTCTGSMVALFAGLFGVATMGMGMAHGQGMGGQTGWLAAIRPLSWPILSVSLILLFVGVHRASRRAQWLVGIGAVILVWNEVAMKAMHMMVLWLYVPAIVLIILGNIAALRDPRRSRGLGTVPVAGGQPHGS